MPERVLVVEDEETLRRNLVRYLDREGHAVDGFATAEEATEATLTNEYAVALVDVRLPGKDGISLATELVKRWPDTAILMMTAYASVDSVLDALHAGVQDYLVKPVLLKDVGRKVAYAAEHRRLITENSRLRQKLGQAREERAIVAVSRRMQETLSFARKVAGSNRPVLIHGESGTGKELLARYIHDLSPYREGPFVAVSVAALAEHTVESCLFGHEKGAFPGADQAREGLFRTAAGGSLFLDDVGDIPMAHQSKLLRAIEAREVLPVGSDRPVPFDARIIAASGVDLNRLVEHKTFRPDLFFRLSALKVTVPALKDRIDDIPALAEALVREHAAAHSRQVISLQDDAVQRLLAHPWPGNVRELSNALERAVLSCAGKSIAAADLPPEVSGGEGAGESGYQQAMEGFERALLRSTLERVGGDRREAAEALGLSLATLYRRVDRLGLKDIPSGGREKGPR